MAQIVTGGVRMVPARATELGYRFRHPDVDEALRSWCEFGGPRGIGSGGAGELGSCAEDTAEAWTPALR